MVLIVSSFFPPLQVSSYTSHAKLMSDLSDHFSRTRYVYRLLWTLWFCFSFGGESQSQLTALIFSFCNSNWITKKRHNDDVLITVLDTKKET